MAFLRKIRGALGTGLVWALAWVLGTLALLGVSVLIPDGGPQMWSLLPLRIVVAATIGFVNGVMFSVVFSVANRRRRLSEIEPARAGVLGLAAGIMFPAVLLGAGGVTGAPVPVGALVMSLVTGGGLGMATAAGSVRIAKSAAAKELLEA